METPNIESIGAAEGAGIGGAAAAVGEMTVGLERAAQAAGDALRDALGFLPWQQLPDAAPLAADAVGLLG